MDLWQVISLYCLCCQARPSLESILDYLILMFLSRLIEELGSTLEEAGKKEVRLLSGCYFRGWFTLRVMAQLKRLYQTGLISPHGSGVWFSDALAPPQFL